MFRQPFSRAGLVPAASRCRCVLRAEGHWRFVAAACVVIDLDDGFLQAKIVRRTRRGPMCAGKSLITFGRGGQVAPRRPTATEART